MCYIILLTYVLVYFDGDYISMIDGDNDDLITGT